MIKAIIRINKAGRRYEQCLWANRHSKDCRKCTRFEKCQYDMYVCSKCLKLTPIAKIFIYNTNEKAYFCLDCIKPKPLTRKLK